VKTALLWLSMLSLLSWPTQPEAHHLALQSDASWEEVIIKITRLETDEYWWVHFNPGLPPGEYSIKLGATHPEFDDKCGSKKYFLPSPSCDFDIDGDGFIFGRDHLRFYQGFTTYMGTTCTREEVTD